MRSAVPVVLMLVSLAVASAIPKPSEEAHKNRVLDRKATDEDHFEKEGEEVNHNPEFDHEMFVGKDEAKTFDQLTPEESQDRLGKIYLKIDRNGDGLVTEDELTDWIKHVQNRYIWTDTERQWKEHDAEDDKITWDSYKKRTYGLGTDDDAPGQEDGDGYNYKDMLDRDRRRWTQADIEKDDSLTKTEFSYFLHPEDHDHMRGIVVDETLEDIDKDKDGFISIEEYIGDMWPNQDGEEEPDWVKTEREQFHSYRDTNKDGRLDREEVKAWIIPPDYDHSEAESKHLIFESDTDRDGKLTKEEVVSKYDLFVGSQATDFGEALTRHDEF